MADFRKQAASIAEAHKLPVPVFLSLIEHESAWNATAVSRAGAIGFGQLMPATARGLGVDPHDPVQNLEGSARYLKTQIDRFGSVKLGLAAYNAGPGAVESGEWRSYPETQRYVRSILSSLGKPQPVTRTGGSPTVVPLPPIVGTATVPGDLFGGDPVARAAFDSIGRVAMGDRPTHTLTSVVDASRAAASAPVSPSPAPRLPGSSLPSLPPLAPQRPGGSARRGVVAVASGANRKGVALSSDVIDFVRKIAGVHGGELTITTGTNHDQFVHGEPGVQSRHWVGKAADIAYGHGSPGNPDPRLTRLGQDALIAAGMPEQEARKQTGGVFNLGHVQVIFNSLVGGNHFNHLHVGL